MKSYKVSVWKLSVNKTTKKPTHLVRWVVDGQAFSESYKTTALADRFRAKLLRAVDKGEPFDTVSGLPDSLRGGKAALTYLELALKYIDARWSEASAKQRDSMTDALATVVPVLVKPVRGRPTPQIVRRAHMAGRKRHADPHRLADPERVAHAGGSLSPDQPRARQRVSTSTILRPSSSTVITPFSSRFSPIEAIQRW